MAVLGSEEAKRLGLGQELGESGLANPTTILLSSPLPPAEILPCVQSLHRNLRCAKADIQSKSGRHLTGPRNDETARSLHCRLLQTSVQLRESFLGQLRTSSPDFGRRSHFSAV